ncbi:hypothetical protein WIW50_04605 [Flavobacteriaceae bacterium 3-367]|uniref:hypothetical protein n=1 Tax=Eudoraea algarum TaxID=3417568 RepID=UPI00327F69A6
MSTIFLTGVIVSLIIPFNGKPDLTPIERYVEPLSSTYEPLPHEDLLTEQAVDQPNPTYVPYLMEILELKEGLLEDMDSN